MDAQILADLIAGSSSDAQPLEIIARLQKMGDASECAEKPKGKYDSDGFPLDYPAAKEFKDKISAEASRAGKILAAFPKGPMGLTPDDVKATTEWQKAYKDYNTAFNKERAFNTYFLKTYKKEYAAERNARRARLIL